MDTVETLKRSHAGFGQNAWYYRFSFYFGTISVQNSFYLMPCRSFTYSFVTREIFNTSR